MISIVSWFSLRELCFMGRKTKENKRIWVIFFLNTPLSWHVCGCQVSAIEACDIRLVKLACSHWQVSRQRKPWSRFVNTCLIFAIWDHVASDVIRSSKIIIMTPQNWRFFGQKKIKKLHNRYGGGQRGLKIRLKIFKCVASLRLLRTTSKFYVSLAHVVANLITSHHIYL